MSSFQAANIERPAKQRLTSPGRRRELSAAEIIRDVIRALFVASILSAVTVTGNAQSVSNGSLLNDSRRGRDTEERFTPTVIEWSDGSEGVSRGPIAKPMGVCLQPTFQVAVRPDRRSNSEEISEQNWLAEMPETEWLYIVLHHSATNAGSVAGIHEEHRRRVDSAGNNWLGIGYHFVIGNGSGMEDGEVAATFRWQQQIHGAHSGHAVYNARGIGICLIGNFEESKPTRQQLEAVKRLVRTLAKRHSIPPQRIIGHAAVKPTACPGTYFPLKDVRATVTVQ